MLVCAVGEVYHQDGEGDSVVGFWEERLGVCRDEEEVVEGVEGVDESGCW